MKLKITLLFSFFLLISVAFSQTNNSDDWVNIEDNKNYTITYKHSVCKSNQGFDYDYILLKFENKTSETLALEYTLALDYGNANTEKKKDTKFYSVSIPANSSIEGTCEEFYRKNLCIFDHSITKHQNAFVGKLVDFSVNVK
ncbi:MAG: hypothetical protein KDE33_07185 [Bacteroidetes bacterium]|nr:hypothetical protein [Bacteroidota bacterium]MCB9227236.1 hypothetical protein [Chitinophagales bacterium]